MHSMKKENFLSEQVFCYLIIVSHYTACILLEKLRVCSESVSVDESFAISSGLLNLVIVLVNDVKQHRLERETQRETSVGERYKKDRQRARETGRLEAVIKKREMARNRAAIVSNSSFHHHLYRLVH